MPTIPMKVHAWSHMLEDLHKYRGMKHHNEEPIERQHQEGRRHDSRLRALRDFETKTMSILRQSATSDMEEIQKMHKDTEDKKKSRKRKLTEVDGLTAAAERAAYLKSIPLLAPLNDKYPSLLELEMSYRRSVAGRNGHTDQQTEEEEADSDDDAENDE